MVKKRKMTPEAIALARRVHERCYQIAKEWTERIQHDPAWAAYRNETNVLGMNIAQDINGGGLGFEHFLAQEFKLPLLPRPSTKHS